MDEWEPHVFLVMRMQPLVEQSLLTCVDSCVSWDEWRGDAVFLESPIYHSEPETFVHGAQVAVVWVHFAGDCIRKDENHLFLTFLTFCAPFLSFSHLFPTYISYVPKINKSLN